MFLFMNQPQSFFFPKTFAARCAAGESFCPPLTVVHPVSLPSDCELANRGEKGTSHAEIGAYLLGLWGIPSLAVEAIAHHHHPTRILNSSFDCTAAVYVADLLDHELEVHPLDSIGAEMEESDRANLEALGVLPKFAEFRELALESRQKSRV